MTGESGKDDGRRPIFTGDDLPPEDPIAPGGVEPPVPPRWDEIDLADDEAYVAAAPATGRLRLDDDNDRLPWLESADDIDADEGFDSGRVIGFVMLGFLALGMIVAAVYFATHRGADSAADGSLIRAEAGPYKVAPENPGGKTFEGTGDTSFAVAQGDVRPVQVGSGEAEDVAPSPAPTPSASAAASATPAPATPKASASGSASAAPAVSGVGVQVGAYASAADAERGWSTLAARHSALAGVKHRVVEGQADFGRVFRLQAVPGDLAAANALCDSLKASGQGCQVKR